MNDVIESPAAQSGLVSRMAQRFGIEPGKFLATIKATAFRVPADRAPVTNEQLAALLLVAEKHRLDPFTKEIYAYPDKGGGIVAVIGIDGWLRIINEHPQFDGMETEWNDADASMTCVIWRKDRRHPIRVTEYFSECKRDTAAWRMVHRMMRHKATMQCARYAFGFAGLHDEDEAQDMLRAPMHAYVPPTSRPVPRSTPAPTALETVREVLAEIEPAPVDVPHETPEGEDVITEPDNLPLKDGELTPQDSARTAPRRDKSKPVEADEVDAWTRRIDGAADLDLLTFMRDEIGALSPSQEREDLIQRLDARTRELLNE